MSLLFKTLSKFVSFPSKEHASFNFMACMNVQMYTHVKIYENLEKLIVY